MKKKRRQPRRKEKKRKWSKREKDVVEWVRSEHETIRWKLIVKKRPSFGGERERKKCNYRAGGEWLSD